MHVLKEKILREIKEVEREEGSRSGEIYSDNLDRIYRASKAYVYLCKVDKLMKEGDSTEMYRSGMNPTKTV